MTKKIEFTNRAKDQIEKITNKDKNKKFFRISVKVVDALDLNMILVLIIKLRLMI